MVDGARRSRAPAARRHHGARPRPRRAPSAEEAAQLAALSAPRGAAAAGGRGGRRGRGGRAHPRGLPVVPEPHGGRGRETGGRRKKAETWKRRWFRATTACCRCGRPRRRSGCSPSCRDRPRRRRRRGDRAETAPTTTSARRCRPRDGMLGVQRSVVMFSISDASGRPGSGRRGDPSLGAVERGLDGVDVLLEQRAPCRDRPHRDFVVTAAGGGAGGGATPVAAPARLGARDPVEQARPRRRQLATAGRPAVHLGRRVATRARRHAVLVVRHGRAVRDALAARHQVRAAAAAAAAAALLRSRASRERSRETSRAPSHPLAQVRAAARAAARDLGVRGRRMHAWCDIVRSANRTRAYMPGAGAAGAPSSRAGARARARAAPHRRRRRRRARRRTAASPATTARRRRNSDLPGSFSLGGALALFSYCARPSRSRAAPSARAGSPRRAPRALADAARSTPILQCRERDGAASRSRGRGARRILVEQANSPRASTCTTGSATRRAQRDGARRRVLRGRARAPRQARLSRRGNIGTPPRRRVAAEQRRSGVLSPSSYR